MTENRSNPFQVQKQSNRLQNASTAASAQAPLAPAAQQAGTAPAVHPTLVPELLGFSPQMLLDDIISAAADAILQCLQAMEPFMQRWADARTARAAAEGRNQLEVEWDGREAVEQGLVAFSTLLESHTDIAFDFFEAWSLRNIFAVPPGLPLVAPHQRGVDLSMPSEEETSLLVEIEELRRKLENQRRLKRMYTKALRIARLGRTRSARRLTRLSYLAPQPDSTDPSSNPTSASALDALLTLPSSVQALFDHASSLPHIDGPLSIAIPSSTSAAAVAGTGTGTGTGAGAGAGAGGVVAGQPSHDPARRLWETSRTGYMTWAVHQLLARSRERGEQAATTTPATGGGATAATGGKGGVEHDGDSAAAAGMLTTQRVGSIDAILQLARALDAVSSSSESSTSPAFASVQNHHALSKSAIVATASTASTTAVTTAATASSRSRTRTPEHIPMHIPMHRNMHGDRGQVMTGTGDSLVVNISQREDENDDSMDTS